MEGLSYFTSRTGNLSCTPAEVFIFVTDFRNLRRFVPESSVSNLTTEVDSCSFNVALAGTVTVRITDRDPFSRVVYVGDAMKKNDFSLSLMIGTGEDGAANAKLTLEADLNPMLKMVASQPINRFLEILISEMENFKGWKELTV